MNNPYWIWYRGDFELYHSILLHSRRQEFGIEYPVCWDIATPYPNVTFYKEFECPDEFTFRIHCRKNLSARQLTDGKVYRIGTEVTVPAGKHSVEVNMLCCGSLPCIYVNSEYLVTDGTWQVRHNNFKSTAAGYSELLTKEEDDPNVFPFLYEPLEPKTTERLPDGILYDYGRETFCRITAETESHAEIYYGESREEALDTKNTLVFETFDGSTALIPRAFRFLYVKSSSPVKITAEYEYLPVTDKAHFNCDREEIKKIWDMCAYTFHLNSREFYLDGIKRDRWVWSGDAYQSYKANCYLYFDNEITKRTILALLGKPPYEQHINTINDYSMYLIIGLYEYYVSTGDSDFVKFCFDRICSLYSFITDRTDENGYICKRDGDWIFIDWSDMDKSAPLAAEQILFWRTKQVMAELCTVCGCDGAKYLNEADELKAKIERDFWIEDKKAYRDCIGSEHITRHPNIFAIIYDFVDGKRAHEIEKCVLDNSEITQITTPYFEFFELCARCELGDISFMQEKIRTYWGGMIKNGATSVWEQYDPGRHGAEHYAMYGKKYGCSLCHAWGAGPIYLLGRYCLGVRPTAPAYRTFEVAPVLGEYKHINGAVPLPDGKTVKVYFDGKTAGVYTDAPGGILKLNGREYTLIPGEKLEITL